MQTEEKLKVVRWAHRPLGQEVLLTSHFLALACEGDRHFSPSLPYSSQLELGVPEMKYSTNNSALAWDRTMAWQSRAPTTTLVVL